MEVNKYNILHTVIFVFGFLVLAFSAVLSLKFVGLVILTFILIFLRERLEKIISENYHDKLRVSNIFIKDIVFILPRMINLYIIMIFVLYILTTDDEIVTDALSIIKYYTLK